MENKLAYHANCWGPLGGHPVGVTSVKDLYYKTFGDMNQAFADIAAAGYQAVELFDGNLMDYAADPGLLSGMLSDHGLRLLAAYSGANFIYADIREDELGRIDRVAKLAAQLGAEHLVVGGGAKRSGPTLPSDYEQLGRALDQVADIAERHGLLAHYHPHLTTMAETPEDIRRIFAHTRILFCPDTAHLAAGGGDPASLIDEHYSRIRYVHLKGWQREPFAFTPLDRGDLNLQASLAVLRRRGFDGWITVELDSWPDPAAGAQASKMWLDQNS